jgi:hypothetical protein
MASGLHFTKPDWNVLAGSKLLTEPAAEREVDTMSEYDPPLKTSEFDDSPKAGGGMKTARLVIASVAGIYVLASLFLMFEARVRIGKLETSQTATAATLEKLNQHLDSTDSTMRGSTAALAQTLGMTGRELDNRTAQLQQQQKAAEKEQKEQIEGVKTEVGSVRTEVGSVKTDVDATKSDLQGTKSKLEQTVGDLGVQSGLIARTRQDLEVLRRRGERNYYEFTLLKGQGPARVSTISLQLKNADPKRGKYTLNVVADDHVIEKKDRTMFEPLQFYTGRDRGLYELVVFTVDKGKVSGYVSTPKEMVAQAQ